MDDLGLKDRAHHVLRISDGRVVSDERVQPVQELGQRPLNEAIAPSGVTVAGGTDASPSKQEALVPTAVPA